MRFVEWGPIPGIHVTHIRRQIASEDFQEDAAFVYDGENGPRVLVCGARGLYDSASQSVTGWRDVLWISVAPVWWGEGRDRISWFVVGKGPDFVITADREPEVSALLEFGKACSARFFRLQAGG